MATAIPIETFAFDISKRITDDLTIRVTRLVLELTQFMRHAYEQHFKVNNAGGAASSLTYEVERTQNLITAVIGSSKANMYLQYLEYGVRGTKGGSGFYARTLAPPIKNIYEWVRLAALPIPQKIVQMAEANLLKQSKGEKLDPKRPWYSETNALAMFAYWIAIRIKQRGTPALHIIEKVLSQQSARIQAVLAGG